MRRFIAVDDCGTRINPMIIEGQVHGGLTDGVGMALMEMISFDEDGNCIAGSLMDYLIPTALEVPHWETGHTVTPSPHHPIGAKGVGESATVGSPPAVVNAVIDALKPYGIRHADMPLTPSRVWAAMQGRPDPADLAATTGVRVTTQLSERIDQLTRSRVPVRAGDGRPRPGAELGARGRPGDRARRRLDRGLRRRSVRCRVGAHRGPRRPGDRGRGPAAGAARLDDAFPQTPGASIVVNPCLSGGALEIYLEPLLPSPVLHLVGSSPTAEAVAALAPALGFVVDRAGTGAQPAGAVAAVVSSHGGDEPAAIRAALDAGVGFVGVVCSRTRGEALLAELDLTEDERRRVHTHVGLDIGARTAPEIALSILAAIVRGIRLEGLARSPGREPASPPPRGGRPGLRDDRHGRTGHTARGRRRCRALVLRPRLPRPVRADRTRDGRAS